MKPRKRHGNNDMTGKGPLTIQQLGERDGRHRKASPQVHSDPGGQPSPGITGAQIYAAAQKSALYQAMLARQAHSPTIYPAALTNQISPVYAGPYPYDEPEAPVKSTGIELGEIIAWRAWTVKHGWLYSMIADQEWEPGAIIKAHEIGQPKDHGIHAFKRRLDVMREYVDDDIDLVFGRSSATIVGQVALWGQIYEFEKGWHGEYAKIHSLDWGEGLDELRKTYGLEG